MPEISDGWPDPRRSCDQLLDLYRDPARARSCRTVQMASILAAARRARAMGHLGQRLVEEQVLELIDAQAQSHFESASVTIRHQRQMILWELESLAKAFRAMPFPVLLLKGAAYIVSDLPVARARFASDVDVLVPKESLATAERALRAAGWTSKKLSDYDERYYRELSHELPPFTHPERDIEVDMHHSITPNLRGNGVDTAKLFEKSKSVQWAGFSNFRVLDPIDQLIHCAVHTFKDSDLTLRLRETMDFDLLFRSYATDGAVRLVDRLFDRAVELGQQRPVWWAIHFSRRWLGSPIPDSDAIAAAAPNAVTVGLMNTLADRAMLPGPTKNRTGLARVAAAVLLARYHHERMPLMMLLPHLVRKTHHRVSAM